jgi:transposase
VGIDLRREKDPEVLRQAALLLEAENRRLTERVLELAQQLLAAQGKDRVALQLELERLQAELSKKNKMLFGTSSERREGDEETTSSEKPASKRPGHGPTAQTELRIILEPHDLDEADRKCKACGGALDEMVGQAEESEEVDVIEREFVIRRHVRKKYRCRCGACIETAIGPQRHLVGGRYSLAFAIAVAVAKYADHLPLERQVRMMARLGLKVDSQTLYDQLEGLARKPYERLGAELLEEDVVFVDETPWPLLGSPNSARWHAWTLATPNGVYYEIHDSRGMPAAKSLLAGYKGIAVTDGYGVYDGLAKKTAGLRLAQCWAHIRRKFLDCESSFPKETEEILGLIRELYAIEERATAGPEGDAERLRLRSSESRAVLDRIQRWCVGVHCTPGSRLSRAIEYMSERWSKATLFLEHARVPLDNNAVERAIRGPVIGRKNHYGSRSRRGTEVAAIFYSLIESAKLAGIDPAKYLHAAATAALEGREPPLPSEFAATSA